MAHPLLKNRAFDGAHRRTGEKTVGLGIRIFEEQQKKLINNYYGNTSLLIRILLDEFFKGKLPEAEKIYNDTINNPPPKLYG